MVGLERINDELDQLLINSGRKLEMLEKKEIINADSNIHFDANFGLLQFVYLPSGTDESSKVIANFSGGSGGSGEADSQANK